MKACCTTIGISTCSSSRTGPGPCATPHATCGCSISSAATLGKNSNVQDAAVLHVTPEFPCIVGDGVTIGHGALVHACTIKDNARIGIGAIVLNGALVEEEAQVGAGALVPPGKVVPAGWLVMGVPAKPVRKMAREELEDIKHNARVYRELWERDYRTE